MTQSTDSKDLVRNVADQLLKSYAEEPLAAIPSGHELPSRKGLIEVLTLLREVLFPAYGNGRAVAVPPSIDVQSRIETVRALLVEQVFRGLHYRSLQTGDNCGLCEEATHRICDGFLQSLVKLRRVLSTDVRAAYEGDPAATGADEVVFSYPGVRAISIYRVAHELRQLGAVIVPRMMTELAHAETGIDIHPGATIGESFFIDHGTGVVIGETAVIGARVRIYQGVTLGALSLPTGKSRELAGKKRHPTIEDDVIIYANATILGGQTVIGRGAVIGGNSWITESVASGTTYTHPRLPNKS